MRREKHVLSIGVSCFFCAALQMLGSKDSSLIAGAQGALLNTGTRNALGPSVDGVGCSSPVVVQTSRNELSYV
jgi:hypothetical protein